MRCEFRPWNCHQRLDKSSASYIEARDGNALQRLRDPARRRGQDLQEVPGRQPPPEPGLPLLLTPEQRFAKHKSGVKAGKYVFRYGLHLVPAMYDHVNPLESRERAEEIEVNLTSYLRRHGYGVWSN